MAKYQLQLVRKQTVAEGTLAFYFKKPAGFSFKAGQCAQFTLIDPPKTDDEGNSRYFSYASTPDEPELMIATRIRDSAFKQVLSQLEPGSELVMKGPYGDFVLPEQRKRSVVFITGGIGVTPVRSMLLHAIHHQQASNPQPITVFYANRRPQDAAFLDELTKACINSANITLIATMSQPDSAWSGEQGYVDHAMLKRHLTDLNAPMYYLDGPPALVAAMKDMLSKAGVDEEQVRSEEFAGY
ncbi:oxidoreductase [Oceanisphaera profunda]|uniref:Oxidoreductase n=1 Tax=Oceanisphaera profunda TaxID=1416627 RepID=A0A1Y0D422_9GAMM|nr:FAD-dependent oxidoreductase [Oceanisphaera profunda]ART82272.1 oxidoreductase [Oceanisphaera profunda]